MRITEINYNWRFKCVLIPKFFCTIVENLNEDMILSQYSDIFKIFIYSIGCVSEAWIGLKKQETATVSSWNFVIIYIETHHNSQTLSSDCNIFTRLRMSNFTKYLKFWSFSQILLYCLILCRQKRTALFAISSYFFIKCIFVNK